MTELRKRFINELKLRNRSDRTIKSYVNWIYRLSRYYHQSPDGLSIEQIRTYLGYLAGERGLSASTLNQALNAVVFFYREVLCWDVANKFDPIKRPKNNRTLPRVYSQSEVYRILVASNTHNVKGSLMLMTLYSSGLRVSEVCALKWKHIEWDRNRLRVEHGKGGKERILPLSVRLHEPLKRYEKVMDSRGENPVFISRKEKPYESGSVTRFYNVALERSGVSRRGGLHCLRHSYATHQLERGVDINTLRVLLGHNSIQTTMVYLQVSRKRSVDVGTPLDDLFDRFEPQQGEQG